MNRWLLASMIAGMGIACAAIALAPARGDEKKSQAGTEKGRNAGDEDPAQRIDKAISNFENRADQDLDQTRKDIERLRKEFTEMNNMYFDMVVSLAELQAEMRAQAAQGDGSDGNAGSDSGSRPSSSERQMLRTIELNRELRPLQDNLRNLVHQKRGEIEQLVNSLRNLRAQQRQAENERNKKSSDSKD